MVRCRDLTGIRYQGSNILESSCLMGCFASHPNRLDAPYSLTRLPSTFLKTPSGLTPTF